MFHFFTQPLSSSPFFRKPTTVLFISFWSCHQWLLSSIVSKYGIQIKSKQAHQTQLTRREVVVQFFSFSFCFFLHLFLWVPICILRAAICIIPIMLCAKNELLRPPNTPAQRRRSVCFWTFWSVVPAAAATAAAHAEFDTAPSNNNNNSRQKKLISVDLSRCE